MSANTVIDFPFERVVRDNITALGGNRQKIMDTRMTVSYTHLTLPTTPYV